MMKQNQKGIALFIALLATSALLLIAFSVADLSYKQQLLGYAGRESKVAFYAADAGLECALFHDLKFERGDGFGFFPITGTGTYVDGMCGGNSFPPTLVSSTAPTTTSRFAINIQSDGPHDGCAVVDVQKVVDSPFVGAVKTIITSRGYNNSCDLNNQIVTPNARNVERALEITY